MESVSKRKSFLWEREVESKGGWERERETVVPSPLIACQGFDEESKRTSFPTDNLEQLLSSACLPVCLFICLWTCSLGLSCSRAHIYWLIFLELLHDEVSESDTQRMKELADLQSFQGSSSFFFFRSPSLRLSLSSLSYLTWACARHRRAAVWSGYGGQLAGTLWESEKKREWGGNKINLKERKLHRIAVWSPLVASHRTSCLFWLCLYAYIFIKYFK